MKDETSLHWRAHEYEDKPRSSDWYWAVGIISVAIAVTSVILGNILFAIIIILGGFSLLLYAAKKPREMDIVLSDKGVLIDQFFYPYHTLESFWIDEHSGSPKLLIKSQKLLMPYISIHINEMGTDEIREFLNGYLPEVFHSESIFHKFMEYLGF